MLETVIKFEPTDAVVSDVYLYGGKSMAPTTLRGQEVSELDIAPAGAVLNGVPDRWAVAGAVVDGDSASANMISQRGYGPDGKKKIEYPGDSNLALVKTDVLGRGVMSISIPDANPFIVETEDALYGKLWNVKIHSGLYIATDLGDAAANRFTDFLHRSNPDSPRREVRLFGSRPDGRHERLIRPEYRHEDVSDKVNGADGAAILAVNNSTLLDMQQRFGFSDEWLSIMRARANLIVSGLEPYAERYIKAMKIGDLLLRNVGPSSRCVETGVDPQTAVRDDNRFLKVLGEAGQDGWSAATGDRGLFFGFNLQPSLETGQTSKVRVGDRVEIAWPDYSDVLPQKPASRQ